MGVVKPKVELQEFHSSYIKRSDETEGWVTLELLTYVSLWLLIYWKYIFWDQKDIIGIIDVIDVIEELRVFWAWIVQIPIHLSSILWDNERAWARRAYSTFLWQDFGVFDEARSCDVFVG